MGEEWGDESRGRYHVNYHTMTDDCGAWTNDCKPYGRNVAASTMMNDLGGIVGWGRGGTDEANSLLCHYDGIRADWHKL